MKYQLENGFKIFRNPGNDSECYLPKPLTTLIEVHTLPLAETYSKEIIALFIQ